MSAPAHDRLSRRHALRAELVTETALHIGTSETGRQLAASDLPVARDGRGAPYIPGSSFRGVLRSGLESLLRGLGHDELRVCDPFAREIGGKQPGAAEWSCGDRVRLEREDLAEITEQRAFEIAWERSCAVCRLFGHVFLASRVRVADLLMLEEADDTSTYIRDGVGLDRDLRTAARGILYNFEAVPAETRFGLRIDVENAEDHEVGLLLIGLALFTEGFARLGGKGSRGLGGARVEGLNVTVRTARDFFGGGGGEAVADFAALRTAARDHYAVAGRI
jgi:CRISPR-associated RAMP protein (TIGR02581 family)